LIGLGAKIDPPHIAGFTMLHAAAWGASPKLVLMLLNRGLDVNARAKKGFTPLMGAAGRHDNDDEVGNVIQVLLDHGADPCAKADTGGTATAAALRANKEERATRLAAACKSWQVPSPKPSPDMTPSGTLKDPELN
jgi:ankyrin repeat protein